MFTAMISHHDGKVELKDFNTHSEVHRWAFGVEFFGTVSKNVRGMCVPIYVRTKGLTDVIDA